MGRYVISPRILGIYSALLAGIYRVCEAMSVKHHLHTLDQIHPSSEGCFHHFTSRSYIRDQSAKLKKKKHAVNDLHVYMPY